MRYFIFPDQGAAYAAMDALHELDRPNGVGDWRFNQFHAKQSTGEFILKVVDGTYSAEVEAYLSELTSVDTYWEGTREEAIAVKQQEVYAVISSAIDSLTAVYSAEERKIFEAQEAEARLYQQSANLADVPTLAAIAEAAGTTVEARVATILANADALRDKRSKLIGLRSKVKAQFSNLTTAQIVDYPLQEEINAVLQS